MTLPPNRLAELQRYMDGIARELLDERLDREAIDAGDPVSRRATPGDSDHESTTKDDD